MEGWKSRGSGRKSVRVNEELFVVSRKVKKIIVSVSVVLLFVVLFTRYQGNPDQNSVQGIKEWEKDVVDSLPFDSSKLASPTQLYLDKYCKSGSNGCSRDQQLMLSGIISILEQSHSDYFQQNSGENEFDIGQNQELAISLAEISHKKEGKQQLRQYHLFAIKNHKLTTPRYHNQNFISSVQNWFSWSNPYEGIEQLLSEEQNTKPWSCYEDVCLITVAADRPIQPYLIQLYPNSDRKSKVQIVGLSLTLDKELVGLKLRQETILWGKNDIICSSSDCKRPFAMILIRIERIELKWLRIFQEID